MKILVVGCGSIGRRHIKNLSGLSGIERIYLKTKIKDPYKEARIPHDVRLVGKGEDIDADAAFICNETHRHIETALRLAKMGMHIFMEKPLSHNMDSVIKLKELIRRKKLKLLLGYNFRFLPALRYIKKSLLGRLLGDLYFARIEAGQYLPDWRKNSDYRSSYSVSRRKGGGVALDLSHEIDYMRYLFGDPVYWQVMKGRSSAICTDSEDVFEGLYRYKNDFICSVHLDYLQREKKRGIFIIGSKGTLVCDFVRGQIILKQYSGKKRVVNDPRYFDLRQTYKDEASHFIRAIKMDFAPRVTIDDGIKTLLLTKPCLKKRKFSA